MDHSPRRIENHRRGNRPHPERPGDRAARIGERGQIVAAVLQKTAQPGFVVLQSDEKETDFGAVVSIEPIEFGSLLPATGSPGPPEDKDGGPAGKRGIRDFTAIEGNAGEGRGGR